ncbi:hypothetical protein HMI54_014679 [Coelomomyces lativittatus]|nr:hypothetical protein HMI54_014679 [Coelomomyces lativittatus]
MSATPHIHIPPFLLTDSYKLCHFELYPEAKEMCAYGEFRSGFENDVTDTRMIFFGLRYILETYICKPWTYIDLIQTENFLSQHYLGQKYPFPKHLFEKMIKENQGYFPVRIEALKEGSIVYPHVPLFQITTKDEYAPLVTYLETLLCMVWYPSTVATLSRRCKTSIHSAFEKSSENWAMLDSRLHDFGFRGCTSVEQSVLGGCAHLLNFTGTDTLSAAYHAQMMWNFGQPIGVSIPASEHSVMTSWPNETLAIRRVLEKFGTGVCACVMDSYDYTGALTKILPTLASFKTQQGGVLVVRPDSGDPVQTVLQALHALSKLFNYSINSKGFKVIYRAAVIQGDGIDNSTLVRILDAIQLEKYAAENVAFGMGGGLLQKVNRDTMSMAIKLNCIVFKDGSIRDVMKVPKGDSRKYSLPGKLRVVANENKLPVVYSHDDTEALSFPSLFSAVYDGLDPALRHPEFESFDVLRKNIETNWNNFPKTWNPISEVLSQKIKKLTTELQNQVN